MNFRKSVAVGLMLVAFCRWSSRPVFGDTDANLRARANRLAQKLFLIDTHMDTPYQLQKEMVDLSVRTESGQFDYVRARQGGLDGVFMAVYVPPSYEEGGARGFADRTIDSVTECLSNWSDKFAPALSAGQMRKQFGDGRISIALGMENGSPLEGEMANLRHFHARGIRYITLCHSKNNHICDSSFDEGPQWHGLSPFGRKLVAEMNRVGMIVDVSHVSDEAFYEVMQLSQAPVVATHSGCRHFTPGWHRNMSDEMIRLLAKKGGVIQINFGSIFVNPVANRKFDELHRDILRQVKARNLQGQERDRYVHERWVGARFGPAYVADVATHIDHVAKLVGVEHVGLGSDFDGIENVPEGLEDVSCYPNLIYELLKKGYDEPALKKICAENFLRVWSQVEKTALTLQQREPE
ncbi:MAG: dipeptidase [Sedimentisphaerales bacterium]|nr:dipeptidase [Sedimentisphaerales bacterium]